MPDTRVVEVMTAGGVDAELAADALWRAGAVAIEERAVPGGGVVLVAATGSPDPAPLVDAVAARWRVSVRPVDPDAALDAWREFARPILAGRFQVRPPWLPTPAPDGGGGVVEVVIDPGRAFGSGSHASTRLALEALGEVVSPGDRVLDVGCGSGVLATAALAAGAVAAVGVDTDPEARQATATNAHRNAVADRLTVTPTIPAPASTGAGGGGGFDVVVANMLARTLIELAPVIARSLRLGGRLVLSGLLADQRPAVLAAYPGLRPAATYTDDGWQAIVLA